MWKNNKRQIWEDLVINTNSRVGFFIFPSAKIKTCLQIEGDAVCRQLQATLLITKHMDLCHGNGDAAISLRHDIFILPDIMVYYCSMPPRETDGWRERKVDARWWEWIDRYAETLRVWGRWMKDNPCRNFAGRAEARHIFNNLCNLGRTPSWCLIKLCTWLWIMGSFFD